MTSVRRQLEMQISQGWRHVGDGRNSGSGGDCKGRGCREGREPRPEP